MSFKTDPSGDELRRVTGAHIFFHIKALFIGSSTVNNLDAFLLQDYPKQALSVLCYKGHTFVWTA